MVFPFPFSHRAPYVPHATPQSTKPGTPTASTADASAGAPHTPDTITLVQPDNQVIPMPWRVCSTPGCASLIQAGSRCDNCRKAQDMQRRPHGNPYNTRGHQWFRSRVLARDPRCTCTGQCGRHTGLCGKPSTVADHYPTERVDLIAMGLDPNDPQYGRGICKACHDAKTARSKPAGFNDKTLE